MKEINIKKNMVMLTVLCGLLMIVSGCCPGKKGYVAFSFGMSKLDEGEYKEAIKFFTVALNTGFENKDEAYELRGRAKFRIGDTLGAIEDYTKAYEENSEDLSPVFYRGGIEYLIGDYEAALRDYLMLLDWDDNYENNRAEFNTNIGALYLRTGNEDSAMIWFSDVVEESKKPADVFESNSMFQDWFEETADEELKSRVETKLSEMIATKDEIIVEDSAK